MFARQFFMLPVLMAVLHPVSAGPLTVISQNWEQAIDLAIEFSFDADYFYGLDRVQKSGPSEVMMSESWNHQGSSEMFSNEGLLFAEYQSVLEEQVTAVFSEEGDYESQLKTSMVISWDHMQFTNEPNGNEWRLDFTVYGSLEVAVTEPSSAVISLEIDFDNLSSFNTATFLRSYIGIQGDEFEYVSELSPNLNANNGLQFIEAQKLRYLALEAGLYRIDVEIIGQLGFSDSSESGGLFFSEGEMSSVVNLLLRDRNAPIVEPELQMEALPAENQLSFQMSDLELGQQYALEASPDMSFSEPQTLNYVSQSSLRETVTFDISEMGPQHFFRLVKVDD